MVLEEKVRSEGLEVVHGATGQGLRPECLCVVHGACRNGLSSEKKV